MHYERRGQKWDGLLHTQKRALEGILRHFAQIVPDRMDFSASPTDGRNAALFLHGPRGSGKTTTIASLMEAVRQPNSYPIPAELQSMVNRISGRIEFLDPIEFDVLPPDANALLTVLSRIEGLLEPKQAPNSIGHGTRGEQEVAANLVHFQHNLGLAWGANLSEASQRLDLDVYAYEARRVEQARNQVFKDFDGILRQVGKSRSGYGLAGFRSENEKHEPLDKLFVAIIDDFDLNPALCLQILRRIQWIRSSRFSIIFLGDFDFVQEIFELSMEGEFNSLQGLQISPLDPVARTRSRQLGAALLRKLIPASHVFRLGLVTQDEMTQLKQELLKDLGGQFGKILLSVNQGEFGHIPRFTGPSKNRLTFAELLRLKDKSEFFAYCATSLLRVPIRNISDFWSSLSLMQVANKGDETKRNISEDLIELIGNEAERTIQECDISKEAYRILFRDAQGCRCVNWRDLSCGFEVANSFRLQAGESRAVDFADFGAWNIKLSRSMAAGSGDVVQIPAQAATWITLLTDLVTLTRENAPERAPVALATEPYLAAASYRNEETNELIHLPWLLPEWTTHFELDQFLSAWKTLWGVITNTQFEPQKRLDIAAFCWISAATWVLLGDGDWLPNSWRSKSKTAKVAFPGINARLESHDLPTDEDWGSLAKRIMSPPNADLNYRLKGRIESWQVRTATMLAPESGIPVAMWKLWFAAEFRSLVASNEAYVNRVRAERGQRLRLLENGGFGKLANRFGREKDFEYMPERFRVSPI